MRLRARTVLADAWASWRGEWTVLLAVAGAFVFLPQLAVLLLVPDLVLPASAQGADLNDPAVREAVTQWLVTYGVWQLAALALARFAQFAIVAWFLLPGRRTVLQALATAAGLAPRLIAATVAWAVPAAVVTALLTLAGLSVLSFPVSALILARMLLVGPAILAERPIGALAAISRSVAATRGNMLMLATVVLGIIVAQAVLLMPSAILDQWMVVHGPNPVARVIVDAFAAVVTTLAAIATALIQVAAWRRLSAR